MKQYCYDGPVMVFEKCVADRWIGLTYAPSEEKARSNLTYQAKKMLGKVPGTRVTLPGKVQPVK